MTTTIQVQPFRQWLKAQVWNGKHNGICRCGRIMGTLFGRVLNYRDHCPQCGSGWTMALGSAERTVLLDSGEYLTCQGHKCRKCGHVYDDYQAFNECTAPPSREMIKRHQEAQKAQETAASTFGMPVDSFKAELNKLRIARGEEPL